MAPVKSTKSTGTHLWASRHPKTTKVVIELPVYDQWKDVGSDEWAGKSCALCSLKTILVFKNYENSKIKIRDLIDKGLDKDGYIENVGWKHQSLVDVAGNYGVKLKFQKQFFAGGDKIKGLDLINKNILKGWPVMASVLNRKKNGGHLVVINGLEARGVKLEHYFVLDPDSRGKNRYSLSQEEFLSVWRGGLLWLG